MNKICCIYMYHLNKHLDFFNNTISKSATNIDFYAVNPNWNKIYSKFGLYMINCGKNWRKEENHTVNGLYAGNVPFFIFDFKENHPKYDYYFFIEYDVRFTGDYKKLFKKLTTDLYKYDYLVLSDFWKVESNWLWENWKNKIPYPKEEHYRNFYQFYCISNKSINFVLNEWKEKYYGHFELVLSTILKHSDLKYDIISKYFNIKISFFKNEIKDEYFKLKDTIIHPVK